jgi:O-antigen/teichoic acid export membrane protein
MQCGRSVQFRNASTGRQPSARRFVLSMTPPLATHAGRAVRWRAIQLVGVNALFLVRIVILARLLAPDDFGLLAIAMVPVAVMLQASEFGMVNALVQSTAPTQRHYDVAWTISIARGAAVSVLVVLAAPWIASIAGELRAVEITRVLALQPLFVAATSIRLADLQRALNFRPLACVNLTDALVNTLLAIALAPFIGVWALVAGFLGGSFARLVASYVVAPVHPRLAFDHESARSLIRYGRWIFLAALVTTAGGALVNLSISRHLGAAALGLYYMGTRLTFLPANAVVEVGTSVSFPIYARLRENRDDAARIFRTTWTAVAALIIPACGLLIALAPSIVADLLGAHWSGTAPVIQVLAAVTILSIFGDLANPIWQGMGQPWRTTLIEIVQVIVLLTGVWLLMQPLGIVGAAAAWLPTTAVTVLISLRFLAQVLPTAPSGLSRATVAIVSTAALAGITAAWIDRSLPHPAGTLLAGAVGVALCAGLLWRADRRYDLGLQGSLARVLSPAGR